MTPEALSTLVAFLRKVYITDFDPIVWATLQQHIPEDVVLSVSNQYLETRVNLDFATIPKSAYDFIHALGPIEDRRDYALRIIQYDDWWKGLPSLVVRAKVLFAAEQYAAVNEIFVQATQNSVELSENRPLWFRAIARIGNYNFSELISTSTGTAELISYLRFIWQKGHFSSCIDICKILDAVDLTDEEQTRYLNTKVRVLRDVGRLDESRSALDKYASTIRKLKTMGADHQFIQGKTATWEYNVAIDEFIRGRLNRCVTLSRVSLNLRHDKYPIPYILLQIARASILLGDVNQADEYIEAAERTEIDKWGVSLIHAVKAEREFINNRDIAEAKKHWNDAKRHEVLSGSAFFYSDIGLAWCGIAEGDLQTISRYRRMFEPHQLIEAKICYEFINIVQSLIEDPAYALESALSDLFVRFEGYRTWLYFGCFSLALLIQRTYRNPWPKGVLSCFLEADYNLSLFGELEMAKAPSVFISYSHDTPAHEDWCFDLYKTLRKNGVDAIIDRADKGTTTIDFNSFMLKGIRDSAMIAVIITPAYKLKIETELGGASVEFGLIRDEILRKNYSRIIFILREGDFTTTIPFEAKGVEQFDFRKEEFSGDQVSEVVRTLLHRIYRIPLYKPVPVGLPPSLKPKE